MEKLVGMKASPSCAYNLHSIFLGFYYKVSCFSVYCVKEYVSNGEHKEYDERERAIWQCLIRNLSLNSTFTEISDAGSAVFRSENHGLEWVGIYVGRRMGITQFTFVFV